MSSTKFDSCKIKGNWIVFLILANKIYKLLNMCYNIKLKGGKQWKMKVMIFLIHK